MLIILGIILIILAIVFYSLIRKQKNSKSATKTKRAALTKSAIVVVSLVGFVVLAVAGIFSYWVATTAGPNNYYVKHFDDTKVSLLAASTKQYLQAALDKLPLSENGFDYITSEYIDGCYADNSGGYQNWQKVCQAELVNIYASKVDVQTAEQNLIPIVQQANWQPTPYVSCSSADSSTNHISSFGGCEVLQANVSTLGYDPEFEISDAASSYSSSNNLLAANGLPEDTSIWVANEYIHDNPIIYSSLTRTVGVNGLVARIKQSGYVSFTILTASKQYFDKNVGFWFIPE
jgi:hypothetical protein